VAGQRYEPDTIEANPLRAADPDAVGAMTARLMQAKEAGDSVGGIVECRITGVPAGLGEPVFDKLEADLAKAVMSIGATRGVEFGAGFLAAGMTASEHNDELTEKGFATNRAGGILGGISTGQEIIFRVAVKPTSSITKVQNTVDLAGHAARIKTEGRHDPCICPRIVPVIEAMAALVIEDHWKRQAALKE
jgi:chorismate synthase